MTTRYAFLCSFFFQCTIRAKTKPFITFDLTQIACHICQKVLSFQQMRVHLFTKHSEGAPSTSSKMKKSDRILKRRKTLNLKQTDPDFESKASQHFYFELKCNNSPFFSILMKIYSQQKTKISPRSLLRSKSICHTGCLTSTVSVVHSLSLTQRIQDHSIQERCLLLFLFSNRTTGTKSLPKRLNLPKFQQPTAFLVNRHKRAKSMNRRSNSRTIHRKRYQSHNPPSLNWMFNNPSSLNSRQVANRILDCRQGKGLGQRAFESK